MDYLCTESLVFAANSLWGGVPRRLSRPRENLQQKCETQGTVTVSRAPARGRVLVRVRVRVRAPSRSLAKCERPPAPVPYAKALPAPVATWLAMRKLPLSQWGAVRDCLFCFELSLGRGAKAPSPPQREFEAKRQTRTACTQRPPTAPCLFLKSPFFASNSLRGGAPRCNLCLVALSLSQPRTQRRCPYLSTRCHAASRRSSPGTSCRSGAR